MMTGFLKRAVQCLIATALLCAGAVMIGGSMAAPGNAWEHLVIRLMVVMLAAMISAVGLVAVVYIKLRWELRDQLRRPRLSDTEFHALLPDPASADPEFVVFARAMAVRYFRSIGGDRFHPDHRLEHDLHLRDLAPFATRSFLAELEKAAGLGEHELAARVATGEITTLGDLVQFAADQDTGPGGGAEGPVDPAWNSAPDG